METDLLCTPPPHPHPRVWGNSCGHMERSHPRIQACAPTLHVCSHDTCTQVCTDSRLGLVSWAAAGPSFSLPLALLQPSQFPLCSPGISGRRCMASALWCSCWRVRFPSSAAGPKSWPLLQRVPAISQAGRSVLGQRETGVLDTGEQPSLNAK